MKNSTSDAFAWRVYDPLVEGSINPLPVADHTTEAAGSGFVYVDASAHRPNVSARMTSPAYPATVSKKLARSTRCLEFYYFIQGNHSLALNVRLDEPNKIVWARNYEHRAYWWKADITLKYATQYRVIFEAAIRSQFAEAKAAIDDITLREGACSRYSSISSSSSFC